MRVGSLFAGIGGFDLGLERAGMRTVWFCEQDPYCQRVLARHWPGVPCYPDVRSLVADAAVYGRGQRDTNGGGGDTGTSPRAERGPGGGDEGDRLLPVSVPSVDVLCGGFPCQDISLAGKGAGIDGERSGLWSEFARLIGELRPRYVIVENVPALLARGMGRVLGDLAALGYDAEWDCLPASAFGAPHQRDRVWIVAYPSSAGTGMAAYRGSGQGRQPAGSSEPALVRRTNGTGGAERLAPGGGALADSELERLEGLRTQSGQPQVSQPRNEGWWAVEPDVGRVAHGVPARVDRLRALGNALVPQIAEWLGRRIIEWERVNAPAGTLTGTVLKW